MGSDSHNEYSMCLQWEYQSKSPTYVTKAELCHPILFCYSPKPLAYICVHVYCLTLLQMAWLGFLPISYAVTRNWTHVGLVASLWGTLTQSTLPTELPRPRLVISYLVLSFVKIISACLSSSETKQIKMLPLAQIMLQFFALPWGDWNTYDTNASKYYFLLKI